MFVVQLPRGADRDGTIRALRELGVQSKPYLPAIHLMSFYRELYGHRPGEFPVCEDVAERSVALPFFPELSESQVARVAEALERVLTSGLKNPTKPAPPIAARGALVARAADVALLVAAGLVEAAGGRVLEPGVERDAGRALRARDRLGVGEQRAGDAPAARVLGHRERVDVPRARRPGWATCRTAALRWRSSRGQRHGGIRGAVSVRKRRASVLASPAGKPTITPTTRPSATATRHSETLAGWPGLRCTRRRIRRAACSPPA